MMSTALKCVSVYEGRIGDREPATVRQRLTTGATKILFVELEDYIEEAEPSDSLDSNSELVLVPTMT
ncbi:hypothetical protein EVAR_95721_1 [Eumeta japonica]|uniref:Uncharacterized protein n=1 Tax=Eumeta variegata TaxID=151549 RepID=A0A4C1UKI1_EUMVA|nr:hypothetical protein EVAR_95721_1 [Eumeta japonica]